MFKKIQYKTAKRSILLSASTLLCLASINVYSADYWESLTPEQLDTLIIKNADDSVQNVRNILVKIGKADASILNKPLDKSEQITRLSLIAGDYHRLEGLAQEAFNKSDKSNLPLATKSSKGEYILELASPYKAVNVPTPVGNITYSLDVLRFTVKAAETERDIKQLKTGVAGQPKAKSLSDPLYYFQIDQVTSAYYYPTREPINVNQSQAQWNHGGGWVGARTIELGYAWNTSMQICNQNATLFLKSLIQWNGINYGYLSEFFTGNCEAGSINAISYSSNGNPTDSVSFY